MGITITIETITPDDARRILEDQKQYDNYRPINMHRVKPMADDLARDRWELNGETIKYNCDGRMLDGQHRIAAIIMADKSMDTAVARGVESVESVDVGRPRIYGHLLKARGEKNVNVLASVLRRTLWYPFLLKGNYVSPYCSTSQLDAVLNQHPSIRWHVSIGCSVVKSIVSPTHIASVTAIGCDYRAHDAASYFVEALSEGKNLTASDPLFVLREKLLSNRATHHTKREGTIQTWARVIKGWNAYCLGRPAAGVASIRWRAGETFPEIVRWQEVNSTT